MKLHRIGSDWNPSSRRAKPGCLRLDTGQTAGEMYPYYAIFSEDGVVAAECIKGHSKRAWAKIERRGRQRLAAEQSIRRKRVRVGLEEVIIDPESYADAELQP